MNREGVDDLQSLTKLTSKNAVASNADGRLEVFVCGTDSALWQLCQV